MQGMLNEDNANRSLIERDEDEENIDALIRKFRSQEEPNID